MNDDALLFDASDALVTADIDLIMDDELPSDALGALGGGADALAMWQDDAARILFACTDPADNALVSPVKPRSASVSTTSTASSSGSDDDDDWRRPQSFSGATRTTSNYNSRSYHQHAPHRATATTTTLSSVVKFEPSQEPCSGEIPYSDLVFWLGDAATGEVECSCVACARGRRGGGGRSGAGLHGWRFSPYQRISSKIPVVSIPRIEGWN